MLRQIIGSCHGDVASKHKVSCLATVMKHLDHVDQDVVVAALQCVAALSDCLSDTTEDTCNHLLGLASQARSAAVRSAESYPWLSILNLF